MNLDEECRKVMNEAEAAAGKGPLLRVTFEDRLQDFLEWHIRNGVVIDCLPYQAWLWVGTRVHNEEILPGDILQITTRHDGERCTIKYPVESVEEVRTA